MRRMILRMIASGSLSAFSAGALGGTLGGGAVGGPDGLRPPGAAGVVQQARTKPAQAGSPGAIAKPAAPMPGQVLPRGSLLDLSV